MTERLTIGISADFKTDAAGRLEPVLAELVDPLPHVVYDYFAASGSGPNGRYVTPADIAPFDAVLALGDRFTADSFSGDDRLPPSPVGASAMTPSTSTHARAGVLLAIAVDAARRPVAKPWSRSCLPLPNACRKDRIVRTALGPARRHHLHRSARQGFRHGRHGQHRRRGLPPAAPSTLAASSPTILRFAIAAELGVELVDIETVFRESDVISINAPLTSRRGLVDARLLNLMKPPTSSTPRRSPIINQDDLVAALQERRIAGGLDVFSQEPLPAGHPLTTLDNVVLAPLAGLTDELFHDNSVDATLNILEVLQGRVPKYTVNRAVTEETKFQQKLQRLAERWTAATA